MSTSKAVIEFQQIACIRCGTARIRALQCPDCGAKPDPREVNLPVQQRQRLLAGIREEELGVADSPIEIVDLEQLAGACDDVVRRINVAAGRLDGSAGSARPLRDALGYYKQVRDGIRSIQPHRQQIALSQTAARVLSNMDGFVDGLLQALVADTPLAAQSAQQRALAAHDRALAEMVDLAHRTELTNSIDLASPASMIRSMVALLHDDDGDFGEWIVRADQRVSKLLGKPGDIVVGLPFALGELIARLEGTGADFARLFGDAYKAIAHSLPTLAQVGAEHVSRGLPRRPDLGVQRLLELQVSV